MRVQTKVRWGSSACMPPCYHWMDVLSYFDMWFGTAQFAIISWNVAYSSVIVKSICKAKVIVFLIRLFKLHTSECRAANRNTRLLYKFSMIKTLLVLIPPHHIK